MTHVVITHHELDQIVKEAGYPEGLVVDSLSVVTYANERRWYAGESGRAFGLMGDRHEALAFMVAAAKVLGEDRAYWMAEGATNGTRSGYHSDVTYLPNVKIED